MKCAVHTDREATGYCRNCGKALCPECTREVRGALYDEDCLAGLLAAPLAAGGPGGAGSVPTETNPALAATLGFIPGLGAVYNGEYVKALIQVVIFGGLIAATFHSDTPGGLQRVPGNHRSAASISICRSIPTAWRKLAGWDRRNPERSWKEQAQSQSGRFC